MVRGGKKALHILDLLFGGQWKTDSSFPGLSSSPLTGWVNLSKAKKLIRKTGKS
jgi:hypothetical protein